jgi:hydroxyacylglutathione hydrolase
MIEVIPLNLGVVYAYLVKGSGKSILVDAGFPGQERRILNALKRAGIREGDISLIVITHGDIDHYGCAGKLGALLDAPVLVHIADREIIRTGINRKIPGRGITGYLMKSLALLLTAITKRHYLPFEPAITMTEDTFQLEAYGIEGYLLHTPGETEGSISMILPDGQVIAGDLIGGILPHTAIPAYSPFSNNRDEVKRSLKKVLDLNPKVIFTGHSRPIDVKSNLRRLRRLTE